MGRKEPSLCCDCATQRLNKHTDLDPETDLFSCQTWRGHSSVKTGKDWPVSQGLGDDTQSKPTRSWQTRSAPSRDTTLHTGAQALHLNTTHSLAHEALATWYLNLPPGREWKMCHSPYLLLSHDQRWLTAGWVAPLCCMMQCSAVGDGLLSFIYCAVMCIGGIGVEEGAEITVPGNISQRSGIQGSAVWHFSTDRWPAESGVAHPYYLLPGCELNINQTSFIRLRKVVLEHKY